MARVRSTARVAREGEVAGASETSPILEMMKHSGLVIQEEKELVPIEDVAIAEAGPITAEPEPTTAEADSDNKDDDGILCPSKPSHIEFGKSRVKAKDLVLMKKLGYFGKHDDELVQFAGEEVISEQRNDEVVVFKSFFRAGL
jgi:hypothetical protein